MPPYNKIDNHEEYEMVEVLDLRLEKRQLEYNIH